MDLDQHISEIINLYSDMVYKLALARTKNKYDADDVFQEVFIRYMKNKNKLISPDHTKAWLIRVTINCSNNIFSSSWFRKTVYFIDTLSFSTPENRGIYSSVMELPKKYRTVIHLFYYEDMSISDISTTLDIKEGTIKSQLHRGRILLKNILEGEIDDV
nr:sigma factor-like helix-turn-helix DNA-binding protein [Tissierella sp.]